MEPQETTEGKIAFDFASALVDAKYDIAYEMLSNATKIDWPSSLLKSEYEDMIDYFEKDVDSIVVMEPYEEIIEGKINFWFYVAISSEGFGEAVSVLIGSEDGKLCIKDIEWGRP